MSKKIEKQFTPNKIDDIKIKNAALKNKNPIPEVPLTASNTTLDRVSVMIQYLHSLIKDNEIEKRMKYTQPRPEAKDANKGIHKLGDVYLNKKDIEYMLAWRRSLKVVDFYEFLCRFLMKDYTGGATGNPEHIPRLKHYLDLFPEVKQIISHTIQLQLKMVKKLSSMVIRGIRTPVDMMLFFNIVTGKIFLKFNKYFSNIKLKEEFIRADDVVDQGDDLQYDRSIIIEALLDYYNIKDKHRFFMSQVFKLKNELKKGSPRHRIYSGFLNVFADTEPNTPLSATAPMNKYSNFFYAK